MRRVLLLALALPFAALAALALLALERTPRLPETAALMPETAAQSRELLRRLRVASRGTDGLVTVEVSEAELVGLLAAGARLLRPLRGSALIDANGLRLALSAPAPFAPGFGWLNAEALVSPSETGLSVSALRVGALSPPPETMLAAARLLLDLMTEEDLGSLLLGAVRRVEAEPGRLRIVFDGGGTGADSLVSRAAEGLREAAPGDRAAMRRHYAAMSAAAEAGRLPREGSAAPWVAFALSLAAVESDLRAALLALAAQCGSLRIAETLFGAFGEPSDACARTTLAGRRDLRQHFALSAALAVAGGAAASFGAGEVKELWDASREKGTGFSFDDIAADIAGLRLAERAAEAGRGELARLAAMAGREAAIMPEVADLPAGLSAAAFGARFGDVESRAYRALVAKIEARVAALPFHAR